MDAYLRNITVEAIGPVEARRYLASGNTSHIDRSLVEKYREDMKYDRWRYPGGVIEITVSGKLKDGHHRLLAIAESGVTLPMIVVRGVAHYA